MKTTQRQLFALSCLFIAIFTTLSLFGQTNVFDPGTAPLPTTKDGYWEYAIAGITPIIIWLFTRLGPSVPVFVLPILTPFVGIGLGAVLNWLTEANLSWLDMGKAGALAVFIRESFNQLVTKRLINKEPARTTGKPTVNP